MNFNLYIFGNNKGTYNQYPNDYTSSIIASLSSNVTTSRSIIVRNQNLMHYIYAQNLGNNNMFGVCLIFNKAYIKHISKLFGFLRGLVQNTLLKQGEIIRYNNQGDIEFVSVNLSQDIKSYEYVKNLINAKLDSDNNYFGVSELTTTYNGLHNSETIDSNTTNTEILKLQQKYNKIIIEYDRGIEEDLTNKIITGLQSQISTLYEKTVDQERYISKLEKTKKQYKKLIFLGLVLLCACGGLYYLYADLNDTQDQLYTANNTISEKESVISDKDTIIAKKNTNISNLRDSVNRLEHDLSREVTAKEKIETSLNNICSYSPFFVTKCEVNSHQFKFDYYCPEERDITVVLKAINDRNSEIVSNSHSLTFYGGNGHENLNFDRILDTSQHYYVVLIYDGQIIAGKHW